MVSAAETLTPVSLELGGKDPMIVLADADLERAANHAVYYSMFNGGQTCISDRARLRRGAGLRRVRGQGHREGAGAAQRALRPAPGTVDVGAMTFPPQVEIVERHVQDAVDKGARVLVGGERGHDGAGRLLVRADRARRRRPHDGVHARGDLRPDAADHEGAPTPRRPSAWPTTRPTASARAVFSKDVARGEAVARRIEAGAVCVNDALVNYSALELPMGGVKSSGIGLAPRRRTGSASHASSRRC